MKQGDIKKIIAENKNVQFPYGTCCSNRCADCRYMEMDNDHYNDGTRRCAWRGEWLPPSTPACYKFSY